MHPPIRWTRTFVASLLRERGFRPRRSLGQNFLVDGNFLEALVRDAGVEPGDVVVEIGSGIGNLTDRLAARAGRVWAFEIDPALHALAQELLAGRENITWILGDGLEFSRRLPEDPARPIRVVANLPYASWRRLLLGVLSCPRELLSCTVMLPRDVVARLRARPGTREYGPMAVLLQGACTMRVGRRAGKELFYPVPRVDSAVVEVRRRERLDFLGAERRLRAFFAGRRKRSPAAGGRRVEDLAPAELLDLARS